MPERLNLFAIATLKPLPLLAIGAVQGGVWILAALAYLTVFTLVLDELVARAPHQTRPDQEFPSGNRLSVFLAMTHFPLMALAVWALTGGSGLAVWERVAVFFAFGLFFGQVSNSNAHELIHRSNLTLHRLGMWVFVSHQFGHHTSAHPIIHHRFVATDRDPNSARSAESFYRFAPRAWVGSFARGLRAETRRLKTARKGLWRHPFITYVGGAAFLVTLAGALGGASAVLVYVLLASYATAQLLLSDYVQHYGLTRKIQTDGRPEPVTSRHSWDAPHWFSNYLMLGAPRHSDHHAHPSKGYASLELAPNQSSPTLPHSLPVMGFIALNPRRWRRVMDPLAAQWAPPGSHQIDPEPVACTGQKPSNLPPSQP